MIRFTLVIVSFVSILAGCDSGVKNVDPNPVNPNGRHFAPVGQAGNGPKTVEPAQTRSERGAKEQ